MKNSVNEMQALRNALVHFNLAGYEIYEEPLRKHKYFLRDNNGISLTGYWNYDQLNHFILGYGKALNRPTPAGKWCVSYVTKDGINVLPSISEEMVNDTENHTKKT